MSTMAEKKDRRATRRLAARVGADLDIGTDGFGGVDITAEAPDGFVWVATGAHCVIARGPADEAWPALFDDITNGMFLCDDPDCEWCVR